MYGSGIGSLNVYVRQGGKDAKVWGLSGDAGNNWYMAQAPIASSSPFRVGVVSTVHNFTHMTCFSYRLFSREWLVRTA